jgi:Tol biopolymer transport system component
LQLYVSDLDGNLARKLTNLQGFLDAPQWSPDGKTVAVLFTENAPRASGPLMPMTAETGVIASKIYEQRLATVDDASGQVQKISPSDMYVYEFDWSPDGTNFAVTAAKGAGDSNWYVAQLYTLPAGGGEMESIYKPELQIAVPRWSPDGKHIAFISGIMSDEGSVGGFPKLAAVVVDVTPAVRRDCRRTDWILNARGARRKDAQLMDRGGGGLDGRLGILRLVTVG